MFSGIQLVEHLGLHHADVGSGLAQVCLSGWDEPYQAGSTVAGVWLAGEEALSFETVEQLYQARLVVVDRVGQRLLGGSWLAGELAEHDVLPHAQPVGGQDGLFSVDQPTRHQREQRPEVSAFHETILQIDRSYAYIHSTHMHMVGMSGDNIVTGTRRRISSGSAFETRIGYCRAVLDGQWVHVSGCSGYDYSTMRLADDVIAQAEQAMRNVEAALSQAVARIADVVRVRYLLADRADFEPCWPTLRHWFAVCPPAATMMVCGLLEPEMKIEIEVTARMRGNDHR